MASKLFHIGVTIILVILLGLLSDSFMFWMPEKAQMLILLVVAVLVCIWTGFVMYEEAKDEREIVHKMEAGRIAYLSGITTLVVALIIQGFNHSIDPWITAVLGVMIVSKLIARLYYEHYK